MNWTNHLREMIKSSVYCIPFVLLSWFPAGILVNVGILSSVREGVIFVIITTLSFWIIFCIKSTVNMHKQHVDKKRRNDFYEQVNGRLAYYLNHKNLFSSWQIEVISQAKTDYKAIKNQEKMRKASIDKKRLYAEQHEKKRKAYEAWHEEHTCNKKAQGGKNFYLSPEWRKLKYQAFLRYGNSCNCCGRSRKFHNIVLHVDHIKPRSKFPDLALEISNLQILCEECNLAKSNTDQTKWR